MRNRPAGGTVPSHGAWSFWQYTSIADGPTWGASSAAIDLDVANGDLDFVRSFVIPEPAVAPVVAGVAMLVVRRRR